MTNKSIIIISILSILAIAIIGCIIFIGYEVNEELKKRRKLQEVALYSEMFKNVSSVYELLDSYINERFNEYKLFHPDIFEKGILNNTQQNTLTKEISVDVIDNMSPAFYNQLTLIFNPNKEKIQKLINTRVAMAVIAESLDLNTNNQNLFGDIDN
jgi:hypothetical protein